MEQLSTLIERTRSGNLEAFGRIVRRFQDMAYGYAYSILGDFHLAQDAAQEAFVDAYRRLADLRTPDAFPGWLRRIVFKHCDRITRRKQLPTLPIEHAVEAAAHHDGPDRLVERREMREQVLDAIRALPEHQRVVTTLFYINGYSQAEVAEFLEVPVTTVKKRLHDSRKRLRQRMMTMVDETLKSHALPGTFADVVVRAVASEADLKAASRILGDSHHGKRTPEMFETIDAAKEARIYVVDEKGETVSAGWYDETRLGIGSTILNALRPREAAREGKGVPDPVFVKGIQGCFAMAKEKGVAISIVHGTMYDHAFCGYVPCFFYPLATLPVEQAKAIATSATIVEANDKEAAQAREAYLRDPYAPKLTAYVEGGVPHVVKEDDRIVGSLLVNTGFRAAKNCSMPIGYVCDVTVQTREAALAVIRLAAELAGKDGGDEVRLMYSHMTPITQAILSLGGTYVLRPSCPEPGLDAEMVAIIDFAALSGQLRDEYQARVAASRVEEAALSIEMTGETVGFVVKGGVLDVVTRKQKVHRILPRWLVTRLVVGYHSGRDALAMGPIPCDHSDGKTPDDAKLDAKVLELPGPEAALFETLFPKMWPTSLPDPDVWPWVLGQEHARYCGRPLSDKTKAAIASLRFPWLEH
ncbi:MAG: sigma-70 family RNA polymerase sigma factor [Verrucomicrobia bacterium]|nr:sigma-70 family RNA polymerase sigma factor [Verrucomicrobiota bacterium]